MIKGARPLSLKSRLYALPVILFIIVSAMFSVFLLLISQHTTFAAPSTPPTPITLATSVSDPSVDFLFTSAEVSSSTFKNKQMFVYVETNNPTGTSSYISSIDEDTHLNHTNPSITEKFDSLAAPLSETAFTPKSWGYKSYGLSVPDSRFHPIPKRSSPEKAYIHNIPDHSKYVVEFGVKAAPGLVPGTYSKQILFTTMTNTTQKIATFLPGPEFAKKARDVTNGNVYSKGSTFKKASAAPNLMQVNAAVVSTTDSNAPIYLWTENHDIFWWSDADVVYTNEDSSDMFGAIINDPSSVIGVDMRGIDTSRTKNMSQMFAYIKPYNHIEILNLDDFSTESAENMYRMFAGNNYTANASGLNLKGFKSNNVTNMSGMFSGTIHMALDLSHLDTSHVTDMSDMFNAMLASSINLTNFNTANVTNMHSMFNYLNGSGMYSPLNLDLTMFDTSHVTDMSFMFAGAQLTNLNLSSFNTSSVVDMSSMFSSVQPLTNLDLSNFDTSQVTTMHNMFYNMINLTGLNITSFNTSRVTNMVGMFADVKNLVSLDLFNFDTRNVTNMAGMFRGTEKLTSLNLSSFDTKKVVNMNLMFNKSMVDPVNGILDISSFDTRSLKEANFMFGNSMIKTIYASPSFVTTLLPSNTKLFLRNNNLQGGNGTQYSIMHTFKDYARIDAPGTPGYFTQKP